MVLRSTALRRDKKMKKISAALSLLVLALFLVAGISNFESITLSGDLVVGDDITITGDVSLGSTVLGSDAFTTTATADTVVISGALATDKYFVTGKGGSVDQQDVLQVEAKADTLIVHRLASGASALEYNWLRIR